MTRILTDALVLRELLCGRRPSLPFATEKHRALTFAVTWPEYLFLLQLYRGPMAQGKLPENMRAINALAGPNRLGVAGWLTPLFDLKRVQELHGFVIDLVVPQAEAAPEVAVAMHTLALDDREATNLVVADDADFLFCATYATVSPVMLRALNDREVRHFITTEIEAA